MSEQEIKNLGTSKIRTVSQRVGKLASSMQFKIMKDHGSVIVVTRKGLLKYMGNAQLAHMCGTKNKDFRTFKTAKAASNFINS